MAEAEARSQAPSPDEGPPAAAASVTGSSSISSGKGDDASSGKDASSAAPDKQSASGGLASALEALTFPGPAKAAALVATGAAAGVASGLLGVRLEISDCMGLERYGGT